MPWIHKTSKFCECGNLMSRKDAKCRKCGKEYLILPFGPYTEECGKDAPEEVLQEAIKKDLDLLEYLDKVDSMEEDDE